MAKKFKVMASNAKKPDGKCIPKSMRKSVESACGKKKAVKASDSECKYRIDIFKKDNPDALVKREFKMFKSEDEAKKYGESIANGNIVNVMKVNAGCTKKSVKSGKVLFPWAMVGGFADGYTCEVSGDSEADCIEKLGNMQDKHGELEYYSGVDDDDYDADGRRIYSSRTKKFGVKASKAAKKRVAAAKSAKQDYITKEFVNLANDSYLQDAYDSGNLTVSLINGDTISIVAEGPNRAEIERKAKAVAKKIYPQYGFYGENKKYKDVSKRDVKSACKSKKVVKASSAAKKRKAIKASGITDDIVIYFNGDTVYKGSIYDMADAIENLCYDDEVNTKFQEWCNQFGDPFDFDGSPIDTAAVFTDIIIHEAEEAPVSEDGKSEFYVDGDGILDFEILYADDIYGAKSIKCDWDGSSNKRFNVTALYEYNRGVSEWINTDNWSTVEEKSHNWLMQGYYVQITDSQTGDSIIIDPDEYAKNFDGEFAVTEEIAEFRDEVWKSMGIGASKNVNAGITVGEDDRYDFSNPIYELDDYVKALADGTVNQVQGITYDISKETIAFFDEDNNVVFVQPIGGIIPEPDDLETDINELSAAIRSEMDSAYGRDNWEQDNDDADYASRAVELSEDIGEVDIDDLEPITGDDVDYGYGYDSNGDAIDESTVEELYRIAEYEILPKSELAKIDEYVSIDEDSWDFYMSSPHVTEKFYIHFKLTEKDINFNDYALPDGKMFPDFNYYTAVLDFDIYAENGEITSVILEDKKIYRPDGAFDDYDVKQFDDLYNVEALINYVEHLAADTVKDIYNGTTNL